MSIARGLRASVIVAIIVGGAFAPASSLAIPPPSAPGLEVSAAQHSDVSPPIRNLQPTSPGAANLRERPLRLIGGQGNSNGPDPVVQADTGTAAATTNGRSFAGVGQGDYGFNDQY